MHPTYQFAHTYGYYAQRYRCPLLYPEPTGETCDHVQFRKEKGCVKDINLEAGGLMRVTLDRVVYNQRIACERINSQAQALGIERPKARTIRSIRTLNTLIYLTINIKALQRVKAINACLLRFPLTLTGLSTSPTENEQEEFYRSLKPSVSNRKVDRGALRGPVPSF